MTTDDTTTDPYRGLGIHQHEVVTAVSYLPPTDQLAEQYTIRITRVPADNTYLVTDPAGVLLATAYNREDAVTAARRLAATITVDGSTALDVLAVRARAELTKAQRAALLDVADPEVRVYRQYSYRGTRAQYAQYYRQHGTASATKVSSVAALINANLVRLADYHATYTTDIELTPLGRAVAERIR